MQSTNFEFLRSQWPELAELGGFAEHYIQTDPASSKVKSRTLAERIAMLTCNKLNLPIGKDNFLSLLKLLESQNFITESVLNKFHTIRISGNTAAHSTKAQNNALEVVQAVFDVARWWFYVNTNSKDEISRPFQKIETQSAPDEKASKKQLEKIQEMNEKLIKENEKLRSQHKESSSKEERENLKSRSISSSESLNFNEHEARKFLIDVMLVDAGWDIGNTDIVGEEIALLNQATYSGKGYADYVLYDDDGTALALIEAKRPEIDPILGRQQAKDYADELQKHNKNNLRPFILLTNGFESYLVDDKGGPEELGSLGYADRKIYGFPSKESLQYRIKFQRKTMRNPANMELRLEIAGRPYQIEAIKAVAECFGEQRRRKALIVQATGTGKTRVAIAIADVLLRANYAKRVLFLCDRKELRRQAKNAFVSFMPDRKIEVLKHKKEHDVEITVATYPAMMQRFQNYDIAYFDLIIADESHRSIYNKYRDLFIYFDAFQLGLTATPRNIISHNTYEIFDCHEGDPTFYYEYERAVKEKNLVDFKAISVTTKFLREGLDRDMLTSDEVKQLEQEGINVEELYVESEKINSQTYIKGTNQAILKNLMENGLQDKTQNGPGKSIIFARNIKHATLLQEWFQEMYPEYGADYCAVIHSDMQRSEQLIDNFKMPDRYPIIAISVDMLDTGVDVPQVLNLVFAKPVKSWVKFWQMIGRGTRLCENLLDEGQDKKEFYIFDHWGNFAYFEGKPEGEEATASASMMERVLESRLELAQTSLEHYDRASFDQTIALVRTMLNALPESSFPVKEKLRIIKEVLQGNLLENFHAQTIQVIKKDIQPLMRYIPIENPKAYAFDLLITKIQTEVLRKSSLLEDYKNVLDNKLVKLQVNIEAVKALFEDIKEIRSQEFWKQEDGKLVLALEEKRLKLRGIMQYVIEENSPPVKQQILNIADRDVQIKMIENFRSSPQKMHEYKLRVRDVLEPLFTTNPTLQKIRKGEALQEEDLKSLLSLTLTQSPHVDLRLLQEFYSTTEDLERELRRIVGMDAKHVKERFATFHSKYTSLSSMQIAFMNLLQKELETHGPLQMESLYDAPFTQMHQDGPEGIFKDEKQLDDLMAIIETFSPYYHNNI